MRVNRVTTINQSAVDISSTVCQQIHFQESRNFFARVSSRHVDRKRRIRSTGESNRKRKEERKDEHHVRQKLFLFRVFVTSRRVGTS